MAAVFPLVRMKAAQEDIKRHVDNMKKCLASVKMRLDCGSKKADTLMEDIEKAIVPEVVDAALSEVADDADVAKRSEARDELYYKVNHVLGLMLEVQKLATGPRDMFEACMKDLSAGLEDGKQVLAKLAKNFDEAALEMRSACEVQAQMVEAFEASVREMTERSTGLHAEIEGYVDAVAAQQQAELKSRKAIIEAEIADLEAKKIKYTKAAMKPESSKILAKIIDELSECKQQNEACRHQEVDYTKLKTKLDEAAHTLQQELKEKEGERAPKRRKSTWWPF